MNKKNIISYLLVLTLTLVMGAGIGCTPQQKPVPDQNTNYDRDMERDTDLYDQNEMNRDRMNNNTNDNMADDIADNMNDNLNDNMTNDTMGNTEAKKLADMIKDKNDKVNAATVLLTGNVAYVGIDLKADLGSGEADKVKNEVGKMVKKEQTNINTVYVTEDADTYTRLQVMAKDVREGKPISGFTNELKNLFQRVTPSVE